MKFICIPLIVICFSALSQSTEAIKDSRDGKTYKTIKIGNQLWMSENLQIKVTGSVSVAGKSENNQAFGLLYSWETAQKSCPTGWHLPNEEEWKTLIGTLGGKYAAGGKLKSNTPQWKSPNKVLPEGSGFNATPGGVYTGEDYKSFSESALYWSSEAECTSAHVVVLNYNANFVDKKILPKTNQISVRCLKNP